MSPGRNLNLVVAACNNMGIGIEGKLPWRLKGDMAFFKKLTTSTQNAEKKNIVIMGKNTWFSIPTKFRPLSARINVVLSSQMSDPPEGAHLARSFEEAVKLAETLSQEVEGIFIIGGASVYKAAIESHHPCRIFMTRVEADFKCDTFFPDINNKFQKVDLVHGEYGVDLPPRTIDNEIEYSFEVYERK